MPAISAWKSISVGPFWEAPASIARHSAKGLMCREQSVHTHSCVPALHPSHVMHSPLAQPAGFTSPRHNQVLCPHASQSLPCAMLQRWMGSRFQAVWC